MEGFQFSSPLSLPSFLSRRGSQPKISGHWDDTDKIKNLYIYYGNIINHNHTYVWNCMDMISYIYIYVCVYINNHVYMDKFEMVMF